MLFTYVLKLYPVGLFFERCFKEVDESGYCGRQLSKVHSNTLNEGQWPLWSFLASVGQKIAERLILKFFYLEPEVAYENISPGGPGEPNVEAD